jgi:hypothetical protein
MTQSSERRCGKVTFSTHQSFWCSNHAYNMSSFLETRFSGCTIKEISHEVGELMCRNGLRRE